MTDPMVAWLAAELGRVERLAGDAPGDVEPWTAVRGAYGPEIRTNSPGPEDGWSREGASGAWTCDDPYDDCALVCESFMAEAQLVAAFGSPTAALRRVAADRQILAEHQPAQGALLAHEPCGDSSCNHIAWTPTCGTCAPERLNGGMEPWPCRTVLLLAEGYGWTGEAK